MLVPETFVPKSLRPKELGIPYTWVKLIHCYPGHCAGGSDIHTGTSEGSALPCSLVGHTVGATSQRVLWDVRPLGIRTSI